MIVGLLLAFNYALVVAGAEYPCGHYSRGETQKSPADQEGAKDTSVALGAQQQSSKAAIYEPDCQKPKDHDEADLCEQRRMARAAEEGGCIARVQLWLSGFGIFLVLGSLWFTGWAAIAAAKAARHAERAVDVQMRVEQPLLLVRIGQPPDIPSVWHWLDFTIENIGKRPAILLSHYTTCEVIPDLPEVPNYGKATPIEEALLREGGERWEGSTYVPSKDGMEAVFTGKSPVFFWGFILYEDVFGRIRMMGFAYEGRASRLAAYLAGTDRPTVRWHRVGGDAYNYDYKEGDPDRPFMSQ